MSDPEQFKAVVGFEGLYEVSNRGAVRSLNRYTPGRRGNSKLSPGRTLKPHITNAGYLRVSLSKQGVHIRLPIHRMVALAFINNLDGKRCVNHKDGVKTNNMVDNLEWSSHRENMRHAVNNGLHRAAKGAESYHGRKTHCPEGHPYSVDNTYIYRTPAGLASRKCKTCNGIRSRYRSKYGVSISRAELRQKVADL